MSDSEQFNTNPLHLIFTAIITIVVSVGALWHYGYLHFAKEEDALLLADFTMLKTVPGQDYGINAKPADQIAQCFDGILVLIDLKQKGLSGVLVDNKKRAIRCNDGGEPLQGSREDLDELTSTEAAEVARESSPTQPAGQ